MKKILLILFAVTFISSLCFAQQTPAPVSQTAAANSNLKGDIVLLNKQDNGKEINVRTGEVIRIELERYGSTGYEWYPDRSYGEYLELINEGTEDVKKSPVKGIVGIPARRWWELRAVKKGETEISIYLYRDWEGKDKGVDSFKIKVKIF